MIEKKRKANLHCANHDCKKPIIVDVFLVEGTHFVVRCYWCSKENFIYAHFKHVEKRIYKKEK